MSPINQKDSNGLQEPAHHDRNERPSPEPKNQSQNEMKSLAAGKDVRTSPNHELK